MNTGSFNHIFEPLSDQAARYSLLGIPYDASSSYRPGCRMGPNAIRDLAVSLNTCTERGVDLLELDAMDCGNLNLSNRVKHAFAEIEAYVSHLLELDSVPIMLGGDHSITMPCFEATLKRYPNLKLLYFDAHPDLYPDYDGDPYSHACSTYHIANLDDMNGDRITQVGIRASTPSQQALAKQAGIETIFAWDVDGFIYESDDPVYLSFDIDVLDPAHAPGCGNPVPGGISSRQTFQLIQSIKAPIVAMDLVEVNLLLDPHGITALAAARVVIECLGMIESQST